MATATRSEPRTGTRYGRPEEALDTTIRLVTPERVTFYYPLGGPFRRAAAYLLDLLICFVLLLVMLFAGVFLALVQWNAGGLILVAFFVLQWGYAAACEALANGQTPGKKALGLRVVSSDGTPITGAQAFLRNLCWPVEGMPMLAFVSQGVPTLAFLPAVASMLLTRKFQRLGDLAAGTMVIVERRPARGRIIPVKDPGVDAILGFLPAKVEAGPDLARALADYVGGRARFSSSQREEMTAPLARPLRRRYGLPRDTSNDAVVSALYARVFLGR